MQLISLNCNHCGAPLEVAESTKFVTCTHCSTRLAIRHGDGSAFTEQLDQIGERQEEMLDRLERIEHHHAVEALDREWERELVDYMVTDKHGRQHLPSTMSVTMSFVVAIFGIFWTVMAGAMFPPMAVFGLLFIGFAIFGGLKTHQKAQAYQEGLRRYQSRKAQLLREANDDRREVEK